MRSHAEAFFAWAAARKDPAPPSPSGWPPTPPPAARRGAGALRYARPRTAAWARAFAYSMGAFDATVAQGRLTLDDIDGLGAGFDLDTMGPPGGDGRASHEPSAFHRTMDESGVIASPPKWFASYRLLVNLFYQQLPLLGVPPMHRYYFCFAVAELVDDVLGSSWQDRLEQTRQEMAQATAGAAE